MLGDNLPAWGFTHLTALDDEALGKKDNINHPEHYKLNEHGIECIDAMEAAASNAKLPAFQSYMWLNIFKYLWRWPYKNGLEDLKKAQWYLSKLIENIENGTSNNNT